MAELADVYAVTRKELASFVSSLPEQDLERSVPATPGWSIRDVIAHLTGDVVCLKAGDFPINFFLNFGSEQEVAPLNEWTDGHVADRRNRSLQDVLDEWENAAATITSMIRGDVPWPNEMMSFAGHVLLTDLAIHQQDIYGALGLVKDRNAAPIAIGFSAYIAGVDIRIQGSGQPALRFVTEDKEKVAGVGEPAATVHGSRFELFRALSGRRSPEQIRAYDWDGGAEPFIEFFYPYGVRDEPLVE